MSAAQQPLALNSVFRLLEEAIQTGDVNLNEVPKTFFSISEWEEWGAPQKEGGASRADPGLAWEDVTEGPWREEVMLRGSVDCINSRIGMMQETGDRVLEAEDERHTCRLEQLKIAAASLARRPEQLANRVRRALAEAALEEEALRDRCVSNALDHLAEVEGYVRTLAGEVRKAGQLLHAHKGAVAGRVAKELADLRAGGEWEAFLLRLEADMQGGGAAVRMEVLDGAEHACSQLVAGAAGRDSPLLEAWMVVRLRYAGKGAGGCTNDELRALVGGGRERGGSRPRPSSATRWKAKLVDAGPEGLPQLLGAVGSGLMLPPRSDDDRGGSTLAAPTAASKARAAAAAAGSQSPTDGPSPGKKGKEAGSPGGKNVNGDGAGREGALLMASRLLKHRRSFHTATKMLPLFPARTLLAAKVVHWLRPKGSRSLDGRVYFCVEERLVLTRDTPEPATAHVPPGAHVPGPRFEEYRRHSMRPDVHAAVRGLGPETEAEVVSRRSHAPSSASVLGSSGEHQMQFGTEVLEAIPRWQQQQQQQQHQPPPTAHSASLAYPGADSSSYSYEDDFEADDDGSGDGEGAGGTEEVEEESMAISPSSRAALHFAPASVHALLETEAASELLEPASEVQPPLADFYGAGVVRRALSQLYVLEGSHGPAPPGAGGGQLDGPYGVLRPLSKVEMRELVGVYLVRRAAGLPTAERMWPQQSSGMGAAGSSSSSSSSEVRVACLYKEQHMGKVLPGGERMVRPALLALCRPRRDPALAAGSLARQAVGAVCDWQGCTAPPMSVLQSSPLCELHARVLVHPACSTTRARSGALAVAGDFLSRGPNPELGDDPGSDDEEGGVATEGWLDPAGGCDWVAMSSDVLRRLEGGGVEAEVRDQLRVAVLPGAQVDVTTAGPPDAPAAPFLILGDAETRRERVLRELEAAEKILAREQKVRAAVADVCYVALEQGGALDHRQLLSFDDPALASGSDRGGEPDVERMEEQVEVSRLVLEALTRNGASGREHGGGGEAGGGGAGMEQAAPDPTESEEHDDGAPTPRRVAAPASHGGSPWGAGSVGPNVAPPGPATTTAEKIERLASMYTGNTTAMQQGTPHVRVGRPLSGHSASSSSSSTAASARNRSRPTSSRERERERAGGAGTPDSGRRRR